MVNFYTNHLIKNQNKLAVKLEAETAQTGFNFNGKTKVKVSVINTYLVAKFGQLDVP